MILERLSWRVTCPNHCKFPSLDICQEGFQWTHKRVDLAPHPVVGLVLQEGDTEKFSRAPSSEGLDPFLRANKLGPCFTAIEEDGGNRRLVQLELACEADSVASPDPV